MGKEEDEGLVVEDVEEVAEIMADFFLLLIPYKEKKRDETKIVNFISKNCILKYTTKRFI